MGHKVDVIDVIQNCDNLKYYIIKYCIFYSLTLMGSIGENGFFKMLGPFHPKWYTLKDFHPSPLTHMNVTPFCFQKKGLPYLKLLSKKFTNGNTSDSLSPNFMNNLGSPFHKLICITHTHHFFYKLDLLMLIKMPIAIMPKYGIHD
jgi:hypothetical protein